MPVKLDNHWQLAGAEATINLPGLRLRRADKKVPKAATHFRMLSAVLHIDFDRKTYSRDLFSGELTAVGRKSGIAFTAGHAVQPAAGQLCFWLVGIGFYAQQGDDLVVLRGGALRVMQVCGAMHAD